jgi:hypothetical protein
MVQPAPVRGLITSSIQFEVFLDALSLLENLYGTVIFPTV